MTDPRDPAAEIDAPSQQSGAHRPPTTRGLSTSHVAVRVVVALLCAMLGFALVVQVRRTSSGDALATARPDDLVALLDGLQHREDSLQAEVTDLRATLNRLRRNGASSEEALAEAQRQAQALGILVGTIPAAGPGVRIVITDPAGSVPPEVLLDAMEELRNAGAEAMQVNTTRIGVSSAFTGAAGAVVLDGTRLTAPYVITAIGDPPTLSAALSIPGGVLDTVRRAGGTMTTSQLDRAVVGALRQAEQPKYAKPAR
jgi:uncharacterized protein YlxW (UPF0749 family)